MGTNNGYDILLKNLTIVDGTGSPSYLGDIAIKGDTIVEVGRVEGRGKIELDLDGLYASPGFIDIHNHSDKAIFDEPSAKNYVAQGVTTLAVGNCGYSAAPMTERNIDYLEGMGFSLRDQEWETFGGYYRSLDGHPMSVNIAPLVGHGNLRGALMGMENRRPTDAEMEGMKSLLQEALGSGAFGMSSGLIYDPGLFANTEELIELSRIVAGVRGIYTTHIRNESDLLVEAVLEAIRIGKDSGARVQISHHKASGKRNWGLVKTTLDLMGYYRRFGVEVTCDVYPFTRCSTTLYSFFPNWSRDNGIASFLKILESGPNRDRLRSELQRPSQDWENILLDATFDDTTVARSEKFPDLEGKTLASIASEQGMDPYEALFELIRKDPELDVIAGGMSEDDVRYILANPLSMVSSDGNVLILGEGQPHPRNYSAFTKVLAGYARDEKVISLENAVRKMSGLPAWKLGVQDRGLLKPGFKADVLIFDLWGVAARSDFGDPHHYSEGMKHILVNGQFVVRDTLITDARPGKALRRNSR